MKKTITALIATILLSLAFTSCEKDNATNGGGNNNEPAITDDDNGIELNMSNNGNDRIFFDAQILTSNGYIEVTRIYLAISSSNNFYIEENNDYHYGSAMYDIARVGSVANMSAINTIPTSGWVNQIAVNPGIGYIIRYGGSGFGYTYARLFVKEWLVNTNGGIIGATVVYQDKWRQENAQNGSEETISGSKWLSYEYSDEDNYTITHTIYFGENNRGLEKNLYRVAYDVYRDSTIFTYTYNQNSGNGVITQESGNGETYDFHIEGKQMSILNGNSAGRMYTRICF